MENSFIDYLNTLKSKQEEQIKIADREREREIKQARRERNLSLLADIAQLAAQAHLVSNGVPFINNTKPYTQKANEYFRTLYKQHREQKRNEFKEYNNNLKDLYKTLNQQNQFDTRLKQQQNQFDTRTQQQQNQFDTRLKQQQDQFEKRLQQQQDQFDTRIKQQNQNSTNKNAYDTYYVFQKESKTNKPFGNVHTAYLSLPTGFKAVKNYIDDAGHQLIVEDPHPTLAKMQQMINIYNYTQENGIEYDAYNTKPFNIEQGYHNYEYKDLAKPTYNPDGSITFKKQVNTNKKRIGYDND